MSDKTENCGSPQKSWVSQDEANLGASQRNSDSCAIRSVTRHAGRLLAATFPLLKSSCQQNTRDSPSTLCVCEGTHKNTPTTPHTIFRFGCTHLSFSVLAIDNTRDLERLGQRYVGCWVCTVSGVTGVCVANQEKTQPAGRYHK